jgi:ribosomal protein L37E
MDFCSKYQKLICRVEKVANARRPREITEGTGPRVFPLGEEQELLDQICEKCPERLFEIEFATCPVCQGEIERAIIDEERARAAKVLRIIYRYRCRRCGSPLYSSRLFL